MAWVAIESFDTYSDGDLNGQNGGFGWGGAWVRNGSSVIQITGTQFYNGTKSVVMSTNNTTFYTRNLASAISDNGVVYFAMRNNVTNQNNNAISFRNSSSGSRIGISMGSSGNIRVNGTTVVAGYSANTWYVLRLTFSVTNNNLTVATNSGSGWSAESGTISMNNSGNIDVVGLSMDGTATLTPFIDAITGTDPTIRGPVNMKTWDGLAKASIKTMDGLAIASVKTWNGLT